jgi:hypothetical protein
MQDELFNLHDIVDIKSPPDINGNCIAAYMSEPQYDDNVELSANVSLTAGGGLAMRCWAVQGNETYHTASLRLTAMEEFVATASGTLPPDLALQVTLRVQCSVYVSAGHTGLCGLDPRSNWIRFMIMIRDSTNQLVARWVSPVPGGPMLTLAVDTDDANCSNPQYWVIDKIHPTPATVENYSNECDVDICPDEDLNVIKFHVPFNGAFTNISATPTLIMRDLQPDETYKINISVSDTMHGMGAVDLLHTIELGETPFVFGTISDEIFTPLPPEDQAKLTIDSSTGAFRQPNVGVDVKPGSRQNVINTVSEGVTTVAILGYDYLDVTQIDPTSIRLEGKEGLRWSIEDVAAPYDNAYAIESWEVLDPNGPDGFDDLVMKFDTQEIAETLAGIEDGASTKVWLTGNLLEEYDGQVIQGYDMVRVKR